MNARSTILEHVIEPSHGNLSEPLAQYLLTLDFPPSDHALYESLAAKAQTGALSDFERAQLDDFLAVNDFLTVLQAKAHSSLARNQG